MRPFEDLDDHVPFSYQHYVQRAIRRHEQVVTLGTAPVMIGLACWLLWLTVEVLR